MVAALIKVALLWAALTSVTILVELLGDDRTSSFGDVGLDRDGDGALGRSDGIDVEASLDDYGEPVTIQWRDLSVSRAGAAGAEVTTVRPLSGELAAGTLTAVMGGSGSGKSTLLRAIRGDLDASERKAGKVFLNDVEINDLSHMGELIGVVPQDDILLDDLTVEQNLLFSAAWRLPADSFPPAVRRGLVLDVLRHLGMTDQRTYRVGRGSDTKKSHISGGQKKRVNIGVELVSDPAVIFLDEPTSGLDSATTLQIVDVLQEVARNSSVAVAAVIHQPSKKAFERFDNLLLMVEGGSTIFMGKAAEAEGYFKERGFAEHASEYGNPADFLMDIVGGVIKPRCQSDDTECQRYEHRETPYMWWRQHTGARETSSESEADGSASRRRQLGFWQQYWVLLRRSIFLLRINVDASEAGIVVLIAAMIAIVRGKMTQKHGANLVSAAHGNKFLALGTSLVALVLSIPIFSRELLFFQRERLVGLNIHAYFAAKCSSSFFLIALMPLVLVVAYAAVLWLAMPGAAGSQRLPRSTASAEALTELYWMVAVNTFVTHAFATLITLTAGDQAMLVSMMLVLVMSLADAVHPKLAELSFIETFTLWLLVHDAARGSCEETESLPDVKELVAKVHEAALTTREAKGTWEQALELAYVHTFKSDRVILLKHRVTHDNNACERALLSMGLLIYAIAWAHLAHSRTALSFLSCLFVLGWWGCHFQCATWYSQASEDAEAKKLDDFIEKLGILSSLGDIDGLGELIASAPAVKMTKKMTKKASALVGRTADRLRILSSVEEVIKSPPAVKVMKQASAIKGRTADCLLASNSSASRRRRSRSPKSS